MYSKQYLQDMQASKANCSTNYLLIPSRCKVWEC